jgi:hypothetical protein
MRLASPALPVHYGTQSSEVTSFRPEVAVKLKTYVYRLIDPRNGETFCVGKGQGNRVFAHIHEQLDGDDPSNKLRHIRDIHLAGFEVAHVIHRHGMEVGDDTEAVRFTSDTEGRDDGLR